jgi:hypothetical protein
MILLERPDTFSGLDGKAPKLDKMAIEQEKHPAARCHNLFGVQPGWCYQMPLESFY